MTTRSDRLQRGEHLRPRRLALHRAPLALEPAHRSIAVEADHEPVRRLARLAQQRDVARMQQVEATVGEADALPPRAPSSDRLQRRTERHDLGFRGREVARPHRAEQVGGMHRRGACLADRDPCAAAFASWAAAMRSAPLAERCGKGRHHRVARAGDVEHLPRLRREVGDAAVGRDDRHAVAAARDQDRAERWRVMGLRQGSDDGLVGRHALPRREPELGAGWEVSTVAPA